MNEQSISTTVKNFLLDLIFPRLCVGCKKLTDSNDGNICPDCRNKITIKTDYICAFCHSPVVNGQTCPFCRKDHALDRLIVATSYEEPIIQRALKAFKYGFVASLAMELSAIMIGAWQKLNQSNHDLIVVSVPLHRHRFNWRGFNQSQLLGERIANYLNAPIANHALRRARLTPPQAEIVDRTSRIENVAGAFAADRDIAQIHNKIVLLIDDIATTGSTLDQCAAILKQAGAKQVIGLVLARNN